MSNEALDNATLVVAHPDDEVLWFSSILERVDSIIVCYPYSYTQTELTEGRKAVLKDYPLNKIHYLNLCSLELYLGVDWTNVISTDYGLKITNRKFDETKYKKNFFELEKLLKDRICKYRNVFTHNPWGEYGHPEHVQVFKAVEKIRKELPFSLWYSSYCSRKSFQLMLKNITFNSKIISLEQNKVLGERIKQLYQKYSCWTWYEEWNWSLQESFIQHKDAKKKKIDHGKVVPINLIEKKPPLKKRKKSFFISRFLRRISQQISFYFD